MDKKSKEALRRYKKSRQQASSSDSSSSDSDSSSSYSSSDSDRERHRKKKSMRRDSSSDDERRKREKRELCQKKLERKKDHLKRKLKAAKLKKRAAAAAAALSSHSYRALSPATQAKLKKIAERDRLRAASKEHREREKLRAREREREHHRGGSRSPTKITKIRIHQDVKRQKSPPPRMHQHMLSREKIIIQARTRDRTPSAEREARQRHEHKMRHEDLVRERERRDRDRERAEREAAREKERAEALARCQERQRERERLAREKLRREEEEKKYGGSGGGGGGGSSIVGAGSASSERMLQRTSERELALSRGYNSRERSLEAVERSRHMSKRDLDLYERGEPDYIESDRRALLDRDDIRRDHRDYIPSSSSSSRRREISPVPEPYGARIRDPRDLYPEEEQRERPFKRTYVEDPRDRESWLEQRDLRERGGEHHKPPPREYDMEPELMYPDERDRLLRERERKVPAPRPEWKEDWQLQREHEWEEPGPPGRSGFVGGPKRGGAPHTITSGKLLPRDKRQPSEPDWDTGEVVKDVPSSSKPPISESQRDWIEHDQRDVIEATPHGKPPPPHSWQMDWREGGEEQSYGRGGPPPPHMTHMHHRSERGGGRGGFRRGGMMDHGERNPQGGGFRPHPPHAPPPALMNLQMHGGPGFHGNAPPRFPHKRQMTFNNPNVLIRKQQAVQAAAKAAAQASAVAAATTAVAAAKAAAQSAANATTNPGILGQVSTVSRPGSALDEKPEAGEIVGGIKSEGEKVAAAPVAAIASALDVDKAELSEISDSEDDILLRTEKKPKTESDSGELNEAGDLMPVKTEQSTSGLAIEPMITDSPSAPIGDIKPDMLAAEPMEVDKVLAVVEKHEVEVEEMPDFEEISDGELEEEARHKGVGDALGVDWASLIAETKRQAEHAVVSPNYHSTTAKQRWQAHRIILSLGISMSMAGERYARRILQIAKEQLEAEMESLRNTRAIKAEVLEEDDPDAKPQLKIEEINEDGSVKVETKPAEDRDCKSIDVEKMHPLACMQVAERRRQWSQQKLLANVCGPNSRALSARRDLQLRRQLCGLPARECILPRPLKPTNEKMKAMALSLFSRVCEVK